MQDSSFDGYLVVVRVFSFAYLDSTFNEHNFKLLVVKTLLAASNDACTIEFEVTPAHFEPVWICFE